MSLVLNVELIGEYKKLTQATTGAKNQLSGLQKTSKNISNKINAAFATIGVGISFSWIKNQLEEASKAAIEDVKSQELLATTLQNTKKLTDEQVASVEKQISKFQLSASVADDELRPAYAKLALSAKNLTETNDLMAIALDVSAGTGKNLDTVVQAMSKALEGNDAALSKLVPSVKGAKDPIAELAKTFDGAAESAANADPYSRMNIIFGEMQEQIGMALLPKLEEFSAWLASPGGQERLNEIVDLIVKAVEEGTKLVDWVIKYKDAIGPLTIALGVLKVALTGVQTAFALAQAASSTFASKSVADAAVVKGAWGAAALVVAAVAATGAVNQMLGSDREEAQQAYGQAYNPMSSATTSAATGNLIVPAQKNISAPKPVPITPVKKTMGSAVVQNITINNSKQTAPEIVKELQKQGTTVGRQYLK